jgi:hypothetical protein
MSLLKYKRLIQLLRERHNSDVVTDLQFRRGIMEIFGTDERTITLVIKKAIELKLAKSTQTYTLTIENIDEII